jgi:hypothetical protein
VEKKIVCTLIFMLQRYLNRFETSSYKNIFFSFRTLIWNLVNCSLHFSIFMEEVIIKSINLYSQFNPKIKGFTDGNGSRYGAMYFMDEDVVLITFQYRLAAFGDLLENTFKHF